MACGFPSPKNNAYPGGLRVLLIDNDLQSQEMFGRILRQYSFEVTMCCLAMEALNMLREKKEGYDIVITDVNIPDMDGFRLLEVVRLEMDLPVILILSDVETQMIMKGIEYGACHILIKPITPEQLKYIWQHVFRKKLNEIRTTEGQDGIQMTEIASIQYNNGEDKTPGEKHDDKDSVGSGNSSYSKKKDRVVWSIDLHQKFINAVTEIGLDKVGPKRILDHMKEPGLTRANVASHLQSYRHYVSKGNKKDQRTSLLITEHPDLSAKESAENFRLHNSTTIQQQNDVVNNGNGVSSNNFLLQNVNPISHEGGPRIVTEPERSRKICNRGCS